MRFELIDEGINITDIDIPSQEESNDFVNLWKEGKKTYLIQKSWADWIDLSKFRILRILKDKNEEKTK